MVDDLLCRGLVLVARYGKPVPLCFEGLQQFGHSFIRTGVIAVVHIVVWHEVGTHTQDVLFRSFRFQQSATDEIVDAIAYHPRILGNRMRRITGMLQRIVARVTQIVDCVEQGAV